MGALVFTACGNSTPKANMKTDIDTLSYAIGVAQTEGLKGYLTHNVGVDTAYIDEFLKGVIDGANSGDDKKKAAYYAGIQVGQQFGNQMVKGVNYQLFMNDSTKTISLENVLAGFVDGAKNRPTLIEKAKAGEVANQKMMDIRAKSMESLYGPNKAEGEKFLAENAKKEGVKTLESGVQYKVIKAGNGPIPADTSVVKVNYEGRLINGDVFDSSYKKNQPATFPVNQVIKGWTEALVHMPVGSVWEIYIPQELAYGSRESGLIKPFSALIFKVELLSIEKNK